MKLEERKKAMKAWGEMLSDQCDPYAQLPEDRCSMAIVKASQSNQWFAFNREYKPLGWNSTDFINETQFPVYTQYKGLTDKIIINYASLVKLTLLWTIT